MLHISQREMEEGGGGVTIGMPACLDCLDAANLYKQSHFPVSITSFLSPF